MIVLALMLLGCGRATSSLQQKQASPRDLSFYDQPAPYTLPLSLRDGQRDKIEGEIRGFLWTHWHQHRLGKLVATWYSKEGAPTTYSYFVEPNEAGIWQIDGRWDSELSFPRGHVPAAYHDAGEFVATLVERVVPFSVNWERPIVLSEKDPRLPKDYVLVLKDKDGKHVNVI